MHQVKRIISEIQQFALTTNAKGLFNATACKKYLIWIDAIHIYSDFQRSFVCFLGCPLSDWQF